MAAPTDESTADGVGIKNGVEVLLTENIRRWIRTLLLLTSDLPAAEREELRKYTSTRRTSDERKPRTIPFELVKSVHELQNGKGPYLHELLEGSDVHLPEVEVPPRNPELEARVRRLRAEQVQKEYNKMTSNVRSAAPGSKNKNESLGSQLKIMNRQLITVFNFLLTVVGSFAFAYKAMEYSMEKPNFAVQVMTGLFVGTIVFFADLYFLMKYSM